MWRKASTKSMKSYEKVNEETGEVTNKYLYFHGMTKDYRFDARGNGSFNINGKKPLLDAKSMPVKSFTFQPIEFRIFTADMFGRGRIEQWIEFLFVDPKNIIASICFNSTNVEPFEQLMKEECIYEGLKITDLVITATPQQVTSKKDPEKKWAIVSLTSELANPENVIEMTEFCNDFKPFNKDLAKYPCVITMSKSAYYDSFEDVLKIEYQNQDLISENTAI